MSPDIRAMRCFHVAARLEHVTRAAEELGIPQPALSRVLARLERDLGVPLFEAAGRSIRLTRFGEAYAPYVERALAAIDDGRRMLDDLAAGERGTVTLGFLRSLADRAVPRFVRAFRDEHPAIAFTFRHGRTLALERRLQTGEIDLAIMTRPSAHAPVDWAPAFEQPLSLIVPQEHRLAGRGAIAWAELAGEPFVAFTAGHGMRVTLERLCAEARFVPTIAYEGDDASGIRGFVAAGFGVALVPDAPEQPGLAALAIASPGASREIGVAWSRERYLPTAAARFRDALVARGATMTAR